MSMSIDKRALAWVMSDDTGSSSKAICAYMTGSGSKQWSYPHDPADLGRCLRLLHQIPEWKPRISEMAEHGPGWAGLIACWDDLAATMEDEVGIDWSKGRSAPDTYRLMQLAIADGFRLDPSYRCTFTSKGHLTSAYRVAEEAAHE